MTLALMKFHTDEVVAYYGRSVTRKYDKKKRRPEATSHRCFRRV